MRIQMIRSKWDFPELPLAGFAARVKAWGFDGCELYLPTLPEPPDEVHDVLSSAGLLLVGQIATEGTSPEDHLESFERLFDRAVRFAPARVNAHTGRDRFTLAENLTLFRLAEEMSSAASIPISHETHRGRALFSTLTTTTLLREMPELRLTADFSHWCCVHESLLSDQKEAIDLAIGHTDYIHARVGHSQGPQVSDPSAPEWAAELEAHMTWWEAVVRRHRRTGSPTLAICPEFGPPPYMPVLPYTRQPVTDLPSTILTISDLLRRRLGARELA